MSNQQVRRKYEWETLDDIDDQNEQESNKKLKRCVTYLKAELNHKVQMHQKEEVEWSEKDIELRRTIAQKEQEITELQKLVGHDKQNMHARSCVLQKMIFETQSKLRNIYEAQKNIGKYMNEVMKELDTWQFDNEQNVNIEDYVYFECGYNHYPLGKVISIDTTNGHEIYEIEKNGEVYEVKKNQIYKTDGKAKERISYPLEEGIFLKSSKHLG